MSNVTSVGDWLRKQRPGHAISDDGRDDYGPELCGGCGRPMVPPNVAWCDDCKQGVCLACHGPPPSGGSAA